MWFCSREQGRILFETAWRKIMKSKDKWGGNIKTVFSQFLVISVG
jgi:hypothetical protein